MSSKLKRPHKPKSHSSPSSSNSLIIEPPKNLFPSREEFLRLLAVVAIASAVAFSCNFLVAFFSSGSKPFCDSNLDSMDSIPDICEPCPSNGECYQGKLKCARGYRRHGKLCVEDGDINETAKKLSDLIENRLCEAYAQFLCHGTGEIWVPQDDIWNDLGGRELMEDFGSDDSIYIYAKQRTMETTGKIMEMRTNSNGTKELKCPDLLAESYKPFTCRIRQWVLEHAFILVPVCLVLVGCAILAWKVHQKHNFSARVEELYCQVCDRLEENALTSKKVNGGCEPWVVASRLRDHLLLPKERKDPLLWKKVEELVQEDSRVDRYPKLVKGESKVVWEWQVEGSLSSSRKKIKGSGNTLKPDDGMNVKSGQVDWTLKAEPEALAF
ncbi:hypothetical protein SLEP1_g22061 [Rubroshorea leprosula]|uniref:Man1/Src1-like C-terminal domain-containing protein n=1 Tax=Rubroshorea leprosula TaxID=152421 RepID=A0AAV5JIV2_9ROSI|nr:hypothetical protein SLEP1_g22061 [Rubroshorea leprosula]